MTTAKTVAKSTDSFHHKTEKQIKSLWLKDKHFIQAKDTTAKTIVTQAIFCNQSEEFNINHCRNVIISDVITRYQRMHANNVVLQIGLDQFGAGIQATANNLNLSPSEYLKQEQRKITQTLDKLGLVFNVDALIETNSANHIQFMQEFFLLLWNANPSFINPEKQSGINYWDPGTHSNISLRQIVNGRGPHSGMLIEIKEVDTYEVPVSNKFCVNLLNNLEKLPNWDVFVKNMQRESIGLEDGIIINFDLISPSKKTYQPLAVFTSRADTILGTTFIAIAADHPLAKEIANSNKEIKDFCVAVSQPDYAYQRLGEDKSQDGIPLGVYAINPINGDHIPIWVTNYVVASYGTGATLGIPGHDQRNFNFAQRHNLTMRRVLIDDPSKASSSIKEPYISKEGVVINSGKLGDAINACKKSILKKFKDGNNQLKDKRAWDQAINKTVLNYLLANNVDAKAVVMTRLRGWKISQQDYWGYPIPLIHCAKCGTVPVNMKDLPVKLPKYIAGKDKLADYPSFIKCNCPKCKGTAKRDTDTLGSVYDSAINHLTVYRKQLIDHKKSSNYYCCGVEHATNHLLTSRIVHQILAALGKTIKLRDEPFENLVCQGSVLNYGLPMTAGYGNAIEVASLLDEYGADSLRLYLATVTDSRHPLNWDENKLFALHGIIDVDDYAKLQENKLSTNKLARVARVLSPKEINRIQNGLLNRYEFQLLKDNKLAADKLKQVMKIINSNDLVSLQEGIFDANQMKKLRKNNLAAEEQELLASKLTDMEIHRLQHGLLDINEFKQLLNNNLDKKKQMQVENCIHLHVLKQMQAAKLDLAEDLAILKIQNKYLDEFETMMHEDNFTKQKLLRNARKVLSDDEIKSIKNKKVIITSSQQELNKVLTSKEQKELFLNQGMGKYTKPLLRFLDKSRLGRVRNYIDDTKMDQLVNFIDDHKLEQVLGFNGVLYEIIMSKQDLINPKLTNFKYQDLRKGQVHQLLRAINACFEFQDSSTKKVNINRNLELHRLLAKIKDLMHLLSTSSHQNARTDEIFVTETVRIILQVAHPIIPHITERIWQELGFDELLINSKWPQVDKKALLIKKNKLIIQENGKKRLVINLAKKHSKTELKLIAKNEITTYYYNKAYPKYPRIGKKIKSVEIAEQHLDYVVNFVLVDTIQ